MFRFDRFHAAAVAIVIGAAAFTVQSSAAAANTRGLAPVATLANPQAQSAGPVSALFAFAGANGSSPDSLTRDAAGNVYGTTFAGGLQCSCGTVFKLAPPSPGHPTWTQTVLHAFTGGVDGIGPDSALLIDRNGALYGTTANGGTIGICLQGCGTVFKLTPPQPGQTAWSESIIHTFSGLFGDGVVPAFSDLIARNGSLYGTTSTGGINGGGTAYELSPPVGMQTNWTETILHAFSVHPRDHDGNTPNAGFIAIGGSLYGTTTAGGGTGCGGLGCGTVYALTPPAAGQTSWSEKLVYVFTGSDGSSPMMEIVTDASGAIYGTTEYGGDPRCSLSRGCGTVYKLTPPAKGQSAWTHSVLRYFNSRDGYFPYSGLLSDGRGNLYGSTARGGVTGAGTIFRLSAPVRGASAWSMSMVNTFTDGANGGYPAGNLIADPSGAIYGATAGGGSPTCNCGVVYRYTP